MDFSALKQAAVMKGTEAVLIISSPVAQYASIPFNRGSHQACRTLRWKIQDHRLNPGQLPSHLYARYSPRKHLRDGWSIVNMEPGYYFK